MKRVELYIPKPDELLFRQQCLEDPKTMEYNAGYQVDYDGYHYDSGCIDFPKSKWQEWQKRKMTNETFFYAYVKDVALDKFVGHVNFSQTGQSASIGIVIKSEFRGQGYMRPALSLLILEAKRRGVKFLTDTLPFDRKEAMRVFLDYGFKVKGQEIIKRFDKEEMVAKIELEL